MIIDTRPTSVPSLSFLSLKAPQCPAVINYSVLAFDLSSVCWFVWQEFILFHCASLERSESLYQSCYIGHGLPFSYIGPSSFLFRLPLPTLCLLICLICGELKWTKFNLLGESHMNVSDLWYIYLGTTRGVHRWNVVNNWPRCTLTLWLQPFSPQQSHSQHGHTPSITFKESGVINLQEDISLVLAKPFCVDASCHFSSKLKGLPLTLEGICHCIACSFCSRVTGRNIKLCTLQKLNHLLFWPNGSFSRTN